MPTGMLKLKSFDDNDRALTLTFPIQESTVEVQIYDDLNFDFAKFR